MTLIKSQKIPNSIAINALVLPSVVDTDDLKPQKGKHVIFACDVSYSMAYELKAMRTQLKNRIPDLIGADDTISIIWFSGSGQAGVLKHGVKVKSLTDLQQLNEAIDRFLVPVGMTGFLEPLILTELVIKQLTESDPEKDFSLIFLTDGYNNSAPWNQIIDRLEKLESKLASATFIEYGYSANSAGLTEMAETVGGVKVFSKDFDSYELEFTKILGKPVETRRIIDLSDIQKKLNYGFVFTVDKTDGTIIAYSVKSKTEVYVPIHTEQVYFFSQKGFLEGEKTVFEDTIHYASVFILADRLKYQRVEEILTNLGDKYLIDFYSSAYGKQKLNEFKEAALNAVVETENTTARYLDGKDEAYTPDPKRYCVMNLIDDLQAEGNVFYPYHSAFNYNRIGAKSVTKAELDEEQKTALLKANTKLKVDKVLSTIEIPEFHYNDDVAHEGSPLSELIWNENRANLSVQTFSKGTVKLPKNDFGLTEVPSHVFRTYNFIKDGILNVTQIPVSLTLETYQKLKSIKDITLSLLELFSDSGEWITLGSFNDIEEGKLDDKFDQLIIDHLKQGVPYIFLLDFSKLPIINRSMTTNISAKKLAKISMTLLELQAKNKYLKLLNTEFNPKTNTESAKTYSEEAAKWLQEIGVTDFNGFSPKTEKDKSGDVYMSFELAVKVAGLSSIPKVELALNYLKSLKEWEDKVEGAKEPKKPTIAIQLLIDAVQEIVIKPNDPVSDTIKGLLKTLGKEVDTQKRMVMSEIAQIKFGLILSRNWFKEFETMDENEIEIDYNKEKVKVKFEFVDKEIAL